MDNSPEAGDFSEAYRQPYWILRGNFGFAVVSILSRSLVPHAHAQYQFIFKLGGENLRVRTSDATLDVSDDSAVILNPWESHAVRRSARGTSLALALEIEQDWLAAMLNTRTDEIQHLFPHPSVQVASEMRVQMARVATAVCESLTMTEADCDRIIFDLMKVAVRDHGHLDATRKVPTTGRMIDRRIRRAVDLLRTRAAENPNLAEIATEVGLSRSHFFRQFKLCVGVSPQHFLDWQRMELASDKLSTTEMPVADISFNLGFAAASHFTRFFVQHMGLPPSDFRRFMINVSIPANSP